MSPAPATVPAVVVRNIQHRWPDVGHDWPRQVQDELRDLCARYRATPRRVLPSRYGFVVAADTIHGGLVMRASPDPNAPMQAVTASALADLGIAPTVHDVLTTEAGTWTVLDEVRPGIPLADVDPSRVTVDGLAAPLAAMKDRPAPAPDMPSIIGWLRERLEHDHTTDLRPGAEPAAAADRRTALAIIDSLAADATSQLCHADASPWNILASGLEGWMLIDPRGMSGEIAYDAAVLALKLARGRPAASITAQLADAIGLDPERTNAWTFIADAARV